MQLLLFDGEEIVSQTSRGRQYSSPNESPQGDRLSLMGPVTSDHNKGANVSARQSIAAKERLLIWRAGFFGFSNLFNGFFGGYAAVSSDKKSSRYDRQISFLCTLTMSREAIRVKALATASYSLDL